MADLRNTTPREKIEPYFGRLVKIRTVDDDHLRVGFITRITHRQIILDEVDEVDRGTILAVYDIVSKKICGEGPEELLNS